MPKNIFDFHLLYFEGNLVNFDNPFCANSELYDQIVIIQSISNLYYDHTFSCLNTDQSIVDSIVAEDYF